MFLGIDLGSTNIKAILFDEEMHVLAQQSQQVVYMRENGFVEFDAEAIANHLAKKAKKEGMGDFSPSDLLLFVQAQLDFEMGEEEE